MAVFEILPGFYFGSFGTLVLLHKLMGAVVCGIMVGIASAAAVSLVVGGLVGTAPGYVVSAPAAMRQAASKA